MGVSEGDKTSIDGKDKVDLKIWAVHLGLLELSQHNTRRSESVVLGV